MPDIKDTPDMKVIKDSQDTKDTKATKDPPDLTQKTAPINNQTSDPINNQTSDPINNQTSAPINNPTSDPGGLLGQVMSPAAQQISVDNIVSGPELAARTQELLAARDQADVVSLTKAESAGLEGPATPQERQLFTMCAEMVENNADLMTALGVNPQTMPTAVKMDTAVRTYGTPVDQGVAITRKGIVVVAADLTASTDAVQTAGVQIENDTTVDEDDKRISNTALGPITDLGQSVQEQAAESLARSKRTALRHQEALALTNAGSTLATGTAQLKTTTLPQLPAGTTTSGSSTGKKKKATPGAAASAGRTKERTQGKKKTKAKSKTPTGQPAVPSAGPVLTANNRQTPGGRKPTLH